MPPVEEVTALINQLLEKAYRAQSGAGYLVFPLECDATITAEMILLMHSIDFRDPALEKRLAAYLKKTIHDDGWVSYPKGPYDISASIKAYYALKCAGASQNEPYMLKIAKKICHHGGLKAANVFTRYTLVQFKQLEPNESPWMPVELILQPLWSPFSMQKFAYWARTVVIPLSLAMTRNFRAKNPKKIDVKELLVPYTPPRFNGLRGVFYLIDKVGRKLDGWIPSKLRRYAEKKALKWIVDHDNKEDGFGGIYTAMEYQVKALLSLGYSIEHPMVQRGLHAILSLEAHVEGDHFMQPCVSPVWDTSIGMHAFRYTLDDLKEPLLKGLDWLASKQLIGVQGDWSLSRPKLRGGGWAFQYNNPFYPDLDDTAMCGWAMAAVDRNLYKKNIDAARDWLQGMQSKDGGFAAFSIDQNFDYLNLIPFADHGALLDPPTEDVTGRVLSFFGELDDISLKESIQRAVFYLKKTQKQDGSWWGRWGTNYLYGTFSALLGLMQVKVDPEEEWVQKSIHFLFAKQNEDGGWGESCDTYAPTLKQNQEKSTVFHTAIVLIALLNAGKVRSKEVERGVFYLLSRKDNFKDAVFNAPGFPRVFYLKYQGYEVLFPLWALGLYRLKSKS